ncbi:MAG: hypothetical protein AAF724_10395 [Pseudomonadota bacterium]
MTSDAMKSVLAENPKAQRDRKVLTEALESLKVLKDMGFRPAGYDLQSPYKKSRGMIASGPEAKTAKAK